MAPSAILDARWRVFLCVAEVGSLSKAATALDMPPSMVSRAVTQLEGQCGERLFQRTGRGVLLTEFATQLLPAVARLAADADALADDIRSTGGASGRSAARAASMARARRRSSDAHPGVGSTLPSN